jgi:hypothetical protein
MKSILLFLGLLVVASGQIIRVDFPQDTIDTSGSLTPWVEIDNTGNEATSYNLQVDIQHGDTSFTGSCWSTSIIKAGETSMHWPWAIKVTSDMR